jgi:hypothetical protein
MLSLAWLAFGALVCSVVVAIYAVATTHAIAIMIKMIKEAVVKCNLMKKLLYYFLFCFSLISFSWAAVVQKGEPPSDSEESSQKEEMVDEDEDEDTELLEEEDEEDDQH